MEGTTKKPRRKYPKVTFCPQQTCEKCGVKLRKRHNYSLRHCVVDHFCFFCVEQISKNDQTCGTRHNARHCSVCSEIKGKFQRIQDQKKRKEKKFKEKCTVLSLLELCCKFVAPKIDYVLALTKCNVQSDAWALVYKHIPKRDEKRLTYLSRLAKDHLDMFKSLGRIFGFFDGPDWKLQEFKEQQMKLLKTENNANTTDET